MPEGSQQGCSTCRKRLLLSSALAVWVWFGGITSTSPWAALAFQLGGKAGEELADGRVETPSGGGRAS